jgi:hypothetical protein
VLLSSTKDEELYGSIDTCYWYWKVPRSVKKGPKLTLRVTVLSGSQRAVATRTVPAP